MVKQSYLPKKKTVNISTPSQSEKNLHLLLQIGSTIEKLVRGILFLGLLLVSVIPMSVLAFFTVTDIEEEQ